MVNRRELLINVVRIDKPKALTGLSQKASGVNPERTAGNCQVKLREA